MTSKRIVFIVLLLLAAYFGFAFYAAYKLNLPTPTKIDASPNFVSQNYDNIDFNAVDGIKLKGWFFKSDSDKAIILVAGLAQNRINNDYYSIWLAHDLISQGYSVLMYDTRGQGESQQTRLSFGNGTDGNDILGAVAYLNSIGFASGNIGIIGDSAGAITILMIADKLNDIGALVIDSAATRFKPVVSNTLTKEENVPKIFHPAIFYFDKIFFNLDIDQINPIDKIILVPNRKFLFLHAEKDEGIPLQNSQELLSNANKDSKLVVFPNAGHVATYKSNPTLYRKEVFNFLERELGKATN